MVVQPSASTQQAVVEPDTTPGDTAVARQAIDSVSDRDLEKAIKLLAVAETAGHRRPSPATRRVA